MRFAMRHAEAEKAPGQSADDLFSVERDPPLSPRGRAQAEAAAGALPALDLVVASPARRAQETARIVARGAEVRADARLRELDVRGKDYAEMLGRILELPERVREEGDPRLDDGELLSEAVARIEAVARESGATLLVSHGLALRAWLCARRGLPLDEMLTIEMGHAQVVTLSPATRR